MPEPRHVADLVDDLVHALLPAEQAADVERHCADCADCRAALDAARARHAALQAVPPVEAPPQLVAQTVDAAVRPAPRRRLKRRVFVGLTAAAAAAAVVLASFHAYYVNLAPS